MEDLAAPPILLVVLIAAPLATLIITLLAISIAVPLATLITALAAPTTSFSPQSSNYN
jgi:hypothetical protein